MIGQWVKYPIVLATVLILVLFGCRKEEHQVFQPLEIARISKDLNYTDQIPGEILELISKLEFSPNHKHKDFEGSYPVNMKINMFSLKIYVEYSDGWIIGSGMGEWGGIVFWLGKDGTYKVIKDDDYSYPIDVEVLGDKIIFMQGMAHLSLQDGHVLEINRDGATFKTRSLSVDGYPSEFSNLEDDLVIFVNKWTTEGKTTGYYKIRELLAGKTERYSPK